MADPEYSCPLDILKGRVPNYMKHLRLLLTWMLLLIMGQGLAAQAQEEATGEEAAQGARLGQMEAIVLGIVEGLTEYLPISSTGHLLLANTALGLDSTDPILDAEGKPLITDDGEVVTMKAAADAYAIVIQAGAILAVLVLYWSRVWQIFLGIIGLSPNGRLLARNLLVAFLPAAVLGLIFDDWIESLLFAPLPIAVALAAGGILMLVVESWRKYQLPDKDNIIDLHKLGIRQCVFIGLMQCVAMWPGTSRSMMTIVGGYMAGLTPAKAAEFSFLLGLITLTAAAGYKAVSSGPELMLAVEMKPLILGVFVAFIFAALSVKWLVSFLTRHGLALFAWYRFALAALVVYFLVR